MNNDELRLNQQLDRIEQQLPRWCARSLHWMREPSMIWVRLPLGLLLIVGGIFSFLPILGFWMLPLGILLLAQDIPLLRRPTRRALIWLERRWLRWKKQRQKRPAKD